MQIVVLALIRSIPPISSVAMFGLFEFIIFAIIGIQLFSGRLGACNQVVRTFLSKIKDISDDVEGSGTEVCAFSGLRQSDSTDHSYCMVVKII